MSLTLGFLAGSVFYRYRGIDYELPRPIPQAIFCVIFPITLYAFGIPHWLNALTYAAAVGACCLGHGQWQSLKYWLRAIGGAERLDFIVRLFYGRDPRDVPAGTPDYIVEAFCRAYGLERLERRGMLGMALSGVAVSLAPGAALIAYGHVIPGLLVLAGGGLKSYAYKFSWDNFDGTEIAEWLTGFFTWSGPIAAASFVAILRLFG